MSLKNGDLVNVLLPDVSIDDFEPKAGNLEDVIVVAFYLTDEDPAEDLNTFIQRGIIDTLDVEVSPNTDEQGRYVVFVEMSRDDTFPNKFQALLKDVGNLAGPTEWKVKTYLSNGRTFAANDPELYNYLIISPEDYVSKDEFMKESTQRDVNEFLKDSSLRTLNFDGRRVTMSSGNNTIIAEMQDVGDYDVVIGRNFLSESAFNLTQPSFEAKVLGNILGNYHVTKIDKYLCVSKNDSDTVMLLRNTELKY